MLKRVLAVLPLLALNSVVFAEEGAATVAASGWTVDSPTVKAIVYFLAVALAAYGGTAAQSRAASAALEGIARNPNASDKIVTPMILGLALMESLVIFTLISVFLI